MYKSDYRSYEFYYTDYKNAISLHKIRYMELNT